MNKHIILDSGAYTAFNKGKVIDIDKYIEFYNAYKPDLFGCFNLDKIGEGKGSYQNWKYLRSMGVDAIPVFHLGSDEKWLKKYLVQTEFIGIGAIASMSSVKRKLGLDHVFKKYFTNDKNQAIYKVHGLGLTAPSILEDYPWYSVDSFTPIIEAILGGVFLPRLTKAGPDYSKLFKVVLSSKRQARSGASGDYFALPFGIRTKYQEVMKSFKFDSGEITEKRIDDKRTLAHHWEARMQWNLIMWDRYAKTLPFHDFKCDTLKGKNKASIFTGVSSEAIIREINDLKLDFDILISFAYYFKETQMNSIINYKKGTYENKQKRANKSPNNG